VRKSIERLPLELKSDEAVTIRVVIDKPVIKFYANDRRAICRRVYPGRTDTRHHAICRGRRNDDFQHQSKGNDVLEFTLVAKIIDEGNEIQ